MHDIEPYYKWRNKYIAADDHRSPYYGKVYDEFTFTNKVYNYLIHPQWDEFGSPTLYTKVLFLDYEEGYAILEFIGEWNDAIQNDIMLLKRNLIELLMEQGIYQFILVCENVLNFHSSDDCYYQEWAEECRDRGGWICLLNTLDHVADEMTQIYLQYHIHFGDHYNNINWRPHQPQNLFKLVQTLIQKEVKGLV